MIFNDVAGLGLLAAASSSEGTGLLSKRQIICFDGTPLVRSWGTNVSYLDLRIDQLAREAVGAIELSASAPPTTFRLLKPRLCTTQPEGGQA